MNTDNILAGTADLFLALGDKTRLRLLNLMRDREVCVSSFTGILGQSQPLISRHLAYLRNASLVEVRRDGKWMYYSVASQLDDNTRRLLFELFKWMEDQADLKLDRRKYDEMIGLPASSGEPRPAPRKARLSRSGQTTRRSRSVPEQIMAYEEAQDYSPVVHHNELEDFLL